MIIAKSPGRAGIIGNPTDGYGGAMIACSIPYYASTKLIPSDKLELSIAAEELIVNWENDLQLKGDSFDLARAVLKYFKAEDLKARIEMKSDIPRQAGLAGSTALLSVIMGVVIKCVLSFRGSFLSPTET